MSSQSKTDLGGAFRLAVVVVASLGMCRLVSGERFKSANVLSQLDDRAGRLTKAIEDQIAKEQNLVTMLRRLNYFARATIGCQENLATGKHLNRTPSIIMGNPVNTFIIMNCLNRIRNELEESLDEYRGQSTCSLNADILDYVDELPCDEELAEAGRALLRLQTFYKLGISDLIDGQLAKHSLIRNKDMQVEGLKMSPYDCYKMGKLAYDLEQYSVAILWFAEAMMPREEFKNDIELNRLELLVDDILDHSSFAAYKIGLLKTAKQLTQLWLTRDPNNERARDNLEYYDDELQSEAHLSAEQFNRNERVAMTEGFSDITPVDLFDDSPLASNSTEELCRQTRPDLTKEKCYDNFPSRRGYLFPGLKIEILQSEPNIIRIHDVITEKEARHIIEKASPKLTRSTIQTKQGLAVSEYRIAKTAWLSKNSDHIVERIERRLSTILNLSMDQSEDLQVVNYGLGGLYGPHMDSARGSSSDGNDSIPSSELQTNDRLATILVYLTDVDAGGATVFSNLNLAVIPVARSAVVWYNVGPNGLTDDRTLHTGCPVLLGHKWIATKWPREEANIFRRRLDWRKM